MMFQILFDHFIGDFARRPGAISDCPKMIAPISLLQTWKLRLKKARGATFQTFDQIRKSYFGCVFDVHMNVVFRDYTAQDTNIFRVANLDEQITTANLYVPFKDVVAILCCPNQVNGQPRNCVMPVPILFHLPQFSHRF